MVLNNKICNLDGTPLLHINGYVSCNVCNFSSIDDGNLLNKQEIYAKECIDDFEKDLFSRIAVYSFRDSILNRFQFHKIISQKDIIQDYVNGLILMDHNQWYLLNNLEAKMAQSAIYVKRADNSFTTILPKSLNSIN